MYFEIKIIVIPKPEKLFINQCPSNMNSYMHVYWYVHLVYNKQIII